jgi:hypothetical protein
VNNLAYITSATIPTVSSTQLNSTTAVVNAGTITLPRLGGTITGVVDQQAATGATLTPINAKTLTIDLSSGPYSSYWYPTYSATTKAITISQYITTTTNAATATVPGGFTFNNLPMIPYGGSGTGYVASSNYPILIDLGTGSAVSSSTVSLVTTYFPESVKLGYAGTTGTTTYSDPLIASTQNYPALKFLSTSTTDSSGNSGNVSVGTSASPTLITLTFNNTLSTTLPTTNGLYDSTGAEVLATLTNNNTGVLVSDTVAISGATLTITPGTASAGAALIAGTTYKVNYSVTDGKTMLASSPLTGNFTFTTAGTYPTLALLTNSTVDAYNNTNDFSVSAPIVLTFTNTLSKVYSTNPVLTDATGNQTYAYLYDNTTGAKVSTTAVPSGNTLTITPAANLTAGHYFTAYYAVTDGLTKFANSPLYSNFNFYTAASTTAPAAVTLALNTNTALGGAATINYGTTSIPVTYTYNPLYTYTEYVQVTNALGAVSTAWSNYGTITPSNIVGTTGYLSLNVPYWYSGWTVSVKLVESITGVTNGATTASNTLTIIDTQNPTAYLINGVYETLPTVASVSGGNNSAGTTAATISFTLTLNGEYMSVPAVTFGTADTTGSTITVGMNSSTAPTTATVVVSIPAGKSISGNTFSVVLKDAAGNQYQTGTPAANAAISIAINN